MRVSQRPVLLHRAGTADADRSPTLVRGTMKAIAHAALGFAVATALFLVGNVSAQAAKQAQAPQRQQRQYLLDCWRRNEAGPRLNQAGRDGWRLFHISPATCRVGTTDQPGFTVVMER